MTVTKSRNLIANRNTGGNKKQGLVPSIGKTSYNRQKQLTRAASNDKTVYCINQIGGIGRLRNQHKIGDSDGCVKHRYSIQNAISDSFLVLNKYPDTKYATIIVNDFNYNKAYIIFNNFSPYTFNDYSYTLTDNNGNTTNLYSDNTFSLLPNSYVIIDNYDLNTYTISNIILDLVIRIPISLSTLILQADPDSSSDIAPDTDSLNKIFEYNLIPGRGYLPTINYDTDGTQTYKTYSVTTNTYNYPVRYTPYDYGAIYQFLHNFHSSYKLAYKYTMSLYINVHT